MKNEQKAEMGSYKPYSKNPSTYHVILDEKIIDSLQSKYEKERDLEYPNDARKEIGDYFGDLELRDDLLQNKSVLDIGSHNHFFDEYCEKKYGTKFVAIDIDEESFGTDHPMGVIADARSLPFEKEIFDLVISHASMPHILIPSYGDDSYVSLEGETYTEAFNDVLRQFKEAYRVLKIGGQIRMSTKSSKEWWAHVGNRVRNSIKPYIDKGWVNEMERINVMKNALETFEKETGAQCFFKGTERRGLIIIKKTT